MSEDIIKYLHTRIEALEDLVESKIGNSLSFVNFDGYGVNGQGFAIKADSVMQLHQIDYNGCYGTELKCYDGSVYRTREWMRDVELKLKGSKNG